MCSTCTSVYMYVHVYMYMYIHVHAHTHTHTHTHTHSISRLCQSGAISSESSIITLKALPALVRLCKVSSDLSINTQAANTLGKRGGRGGEMGEERVREAQGRKRRCEHKWFSSADRKWAGGSKCTCTMYKGHTTYTLQW